ncbi:MAG: endonuclease III [Gammaproteobacteria bacterium]|nr:endonuclease III [Gammaproteobacteria bacterium]
MFARLRAADPAPSSELRYASVFELLVSVMLSAQATDVSVNLATAKLYPLANTPQGMLDLGLRKLKSHIKTIGLYNTKAKNILATCRLLLERHGGEVPGDMDALTALPGVGRKTANVVLNTAFGHPTIAVDTHVFRVSNRTRIAPGKDVAEVERGLLRAVPDEFKQHAHHWLILLGRHTCIARKPKCAECVVNDLCPSAGK